jgi:hypothetical protein
MTRPRTLNIVEVVPDLGHKVRAATTLVLEPADGVDPRGWQLRRHLCAQGSSIRLRRLHRHPGAPWPSTGGIAKSGAGVWLVHRDVSPGKMQASFLTVGEVKARRAWR